MRGREGPGHLALEVVVVAVEDFDHERYRAEAHHIPPMENQQIHHREFSRRKAYSPCPITSLRANPVGRDTIAETRAAQLLLPSQVGWCIVRVRPPSAQRCRA